MKATMDSGLFEGRYKIPQVKPGAAACAVLLLGLPAGACLFAAGFSLRGALLTALCLVILGPLAVRLAQPGADVFEPIVAANVAFAVMFIARPVADLADGSLYHLGYDFSSTFDRALAVALAGTAAFQAGYFCVAARRLAEFLPKPAPELEFGKARRVAVVTAIAGVALFAGFLAQSGGTTILLALLQGRQAGDNALFLGSTAYLYFGLFALVPASLLFLAVGMHGRAPISLAAAAGTAGIVLLYGLARGDRSGVLPLVAVPIFWYLTKGRRPGTAPLVMVAVTALMASGLVRDVRTVALRGSAAGTLRAAVADPASEITNLLRGADTEMFDALATELLIVPETLPFRPGGSVTDLGVRAVPRLLWREKPLEVNDAVVQALWPAHYQQSRAAPAFSVLGPFYGDSGWLGVVAGMTLLGTATGALRHWYLRHAASAAAQICYALALPLVVLLMRGTVPDTLGHALFIVVPAVAVTLGGGAGRQAAGPRHAI